VSGYFFSDRRIIIRFHPSAVMILPGFKLGRGAKKEASST
jgi:hypothetical protein